MPVQLRVGVDGARGGVGGLRGEATELEVFELALARVVERVAGALGAQEGWVDGVRAGVVALLEFFDEEPALARFLVVDSAQGCPGVLARRAEVLQRVAVFLDDERAPARSFPAPLTAHAVASGVLGVLHTRLCEPQPGVLAELAGPLMSFMVLPFLGARAARRELQQPTDTTPSSVAGADVDLLQGPGRRLGQHRESAVLSVLADEPGLNSTQVGLRAGIKDRAHVSRLMARMWRLGLIENEPGPALRRGVKAWRLTVSGQQLHAAACREAHTPAGVLPDLPAEFAGRLDFWGVCLLRAIGEQPWLTGSELAPRAGVDPAQIAGLLAQLAGLGLIDSARDIHRKGSPKVWQITGHGRELQNTITHTTPARTLAPAGSRALDLMWQSGGRVSERAIAVLRVAAAQPGLSNREIAQRIGVTDANSTSQLLANLTRRGLIKNTRNGGRENAWVLTANGHSLQRAIRHHTPTPARSVATNLLNEAGGRLNHRVVSVLSTISTEPGLSNTDIAERLGIQSKGHTSTLLARLARYGLIKNQTPDRPFQANAWQLTTTGTQLHTAIRTCTTTTKENQ